tara:strand:+ start:1343 stop:1552 length:210 start_codon:yes stop_codon:yes gene_type:complete
MDLATAQEKLELWQNAEDALARSQSYTHGDVSVTRQDLKEVRNQITKYSRLVAQLSNNDTSLSAVATFK